MDFNISNDNGARLINAARNRDGSASEVLNEIIEDALCDESTSIPYDSLEIWDDLPAPDELRRLITEIVESDVDCEASYDGYDESHQVYHTSVELDGCELPDEGEDGPDVWVSGEGVLTQNFDRTSKVMDMSLSIHLVYKRNEDGKAQWAEVEDDRVWSEVV